MTIQELKDKITNNEILPSTLIFKLTKSEGSNFIFHQYIQEYSKQNNLDISYLEDIDNISSSNLFDTISNNIYIYETTKLDKIPQNNSDNIWIKCTSIPKKFLDKYSSIIIELPTLENWQIKDYIFTNLSDLDNQYIEKLFANYKDNLFRLELEVEKLSLFDDYNKKYKELESQLFVDSTEYSVFDITNSILRRDINSLVKLKDNLSIIDIDTFGLIKILINNFRYVIDIQLAKNPTPEYVGISNKQFWAIKNYSCGFYSKDELVYIYKFLLSLDEKIKFGYISTNNLVDYIICKIMLL